MKNAVTLEYLGILIHNKLLENTQTIESAKNFLNVGNTISPPELINDSTTIENTLYQCIQIDKLFIEKKNSFDGYTKLIEISKLIKKDERVYEKYVCHNFTISTTFSTNGTRSDKVLKFGSYCGKEKKRMEEENPFLSFDTLQSSNISEFYSGITTTDTKKTKIENSLSFLYDMFICEYTRDPSVIFTFSMCLKISYHIIDNIHNKTMIEQFFDIKNCSEFFSLNQQIDKNSNKKKTDTEVHKKLLERKEIITKDFETINSFLETEDYNISNALIIRHIFNYYFPLSILYFWPLNFNIDLLPLGSRTPHRDPVRRANLKTSF